jgi:hypothetical protein
MITGWFTVPGFINHLKHKLKALREVTQNLLRSIYRVKEFVYAAEASLRRGNLQVTV